MMNSAAAEIRQSRDSSDIRLTSDATPMETNLIRLSPAHRIAENS